MSTATDLTRSVDRATTTLVAGRYELVSLIARGGMGEVFSANDRALGRTIALKRLLPNSPQHRASDLSFRREFHALAQLRHPRVIEVYDYGVDEGAPFYTMELLDGHDLVDLSPMPYREACLHLRDIASSLAMLHARRLLHRDVSPRNVRRTSAGRCKLIDFGAMVPFGVPLNVTGTPPSISPEAFHGGSLDQRSDLYSLGALAYFCLTGRHCYAASKIAELPDAWCVPVIRANQLVPDLPEALDDLVMSLLNPDPLLRPKSAAEVIEWLSAIGELPPDDAVSVAGSFLTSTRICGRASVLSELTSRLQRARDGRGSAVLIAGAAGSGKSRMLAEATLIAQNHGLCAVHVTARRQRGSALALAHDLLSALALTLPLDAAKAGIDSVVWPAVAAANDNQHAQVLPVADTVEQRAYLNQQLSDVICKIAQARPLLLAIDDFEHSDEFSNALIAGLARQATRLPLALVVTETEAHGHASPAHSRAQQAVGHVVHLRELDLAATSELLKSMFDDVPHLERLAAWSFGVARGNPKQTIELAEYLMSRGLIRYADGTWELPAEDLHEAVPQTMAETWLQRIHSLSERALSVAELLCVRRGGATAELCLAARCDREAAVDSVLVALDELVREGILECAGEEYVFRQDTLRKTLQQSLDAERAAALHARWAEVLLTGDGTNWDVQLEAGWHLMHTTDELRGADIIAQVGPLLVERRLAMETAVPAIEKTLEIYERRQHLPHECLRLRSTLVVAGYLSDYRIVRRYGGETLAMLSQSSGIQLANRLRKYLGGRFGLAVALFTTAVRRPWLPRARRGPPVRTAIKYFARCAMGVMGVRGTGLDAAGARELLAQMEPLKYAPKSSSGPVLYEVCRAISLQVLGREGELTRALRTALTTLRAGRARDMSPAEHENLLVGMMLADGLAESYRVQSKALARADALDKIGTRLAKAAALRVRMFYYLRRGDSERAEKCRYQLDLHAIQAGHAWQVEWFVSPLEAMAGAAWSDMVMIRRALERLERLVDEVPSLTPLRDSARISYAFRRGEFARAAALGERFIAQHAPQTVVGWGVAYSMIAMAFIETGRAAEAKLLCEDALARLTEDDRAYFVLYDALEVAYAMSMAVLGEHERADAILDALFEQRKAQGEHVILVGFYQYRARMARLVGDRSRLADALHSMRTAALSSGFPPVILLADRVAELRAKDEQILLPRAEYTTSSRAPGSEVTAASQYLSNLGTSSDRSRRALQLLAGWVAADQAFLFARVGDSVQLVASLSHATAPALLHQRVVAALSVSAAANDVSAIEVLELPDEAQRIQRFQIALLPDDLDPKLIVGAVVVRECDALLDRLPADMITDIGRVLAEDIRTQRLTAKPQP